MCRSCLSVPSVMTNSGHLFDFQTRSTIWLSNHDPTWTSYWHSTFHLWTGYIFLDVRSVVFSVSLLDVKFRSTEGVVLQRQATSFFRLLPTSNVGVRGTSLRAIYSPNVSKFWLILDFFFILLLNVSRCFLYHWFSCSCSISTLNWVQLDVIWTPMTGAGNVYMM